MKTIFKAFAYLYVAAALAPLLLLTLAIGFSLAGGGSAWPFTPYGATQVEEESQPLDQDITFRAGPVLVAGEVEDGTARYAIGVGQASTPTRPVTSIASSGPVDTFYVLAADVEYIGDTASQAGELNNVLIQPKAGATWVKVFERRVSVKFFAPVKTPNGGALVILATDKDTNKDGKINSKDIHGLYIGALDGAAPREIAGVVGNVIALDAISQPGALLVRAVLDSNGDGSATRGGAFPYGRIAEEPQRVYRIDLKTLEASPLVPPSTIDDLRKGLDAPAAPQQAPTPKD